MSIKAAVSEACPLHNHRDAGLFQAALPKDGRRRIYDAVPRFLLVFFRPWHDEFSPDFSSDNAADLRGCLVTLRRPALAARKYALTLHYIHHIVALKENMMYVIL